MRNPKFLEIDNKFFGGLLITDYSREINEIILKKLLNSNINMNISIFYEKLDSNKTIKNLTYFIGNNAADLKNGNTNKEDIDLIAFSYNDAKYIRKEMQVNNEELFFIYIYILVYANSEKELEENLLRVEGLIETSGMFSRRANFREEQVFEAVLPIAENSNDIKEVSRRNVLSKGLSATYPFISSNICDENGIFFGSNLFNNSMIFVDKFNKEKYKNSNMCIFGTSGAGKSFFTKLQILRYRLLGVEQYVIDPEREYNILSENLDGLLIKFGPSSNTFINVLEIREESIEEEKGYLATKLSKLRGFFSLIFNNLDEEKISLLEEKLIKIYEKKGITFDDMSLYNKNYNSGKLEFKSSKEMPILEDLYYELEKDKNTIFLKRELYPFVFGSLKFLNNYTNVELNNLLIIADIYELGEENIKYGMYIFTELFWDKIKKNRNKNKTIYLDEIWRLIGVTSNKFVASFIYKIFKTIRKYGGSAVAITQDISDLFSLEEGTYGKSILNNSNIKTFFSLEEENILVLEKYANLSEKEKIEIKSLKRGECLLFIGGNHILVKIESSETEKNSVV